MPSSAELRRLARDWEDLAEVDPFWAVLTHPEQRGGRWDREAFFAEGEHDVARALAGADALGVPERRGRALDFGCGLGRTARALAARYGEVVGVDVSSRIVEQARALHGDLASVRFEVNAREELSAFGDGSFDLVFSTLVLQHLPSARMVERYLAEFVRLLAPGGAAVFQLPTRVPLRNRVQPRRRAYTALRRAGLAPATLHHRWGLDPIRVRALSPAAVTCIVERAGGRVADVRADRLAGAFPSATYVVVAVA